MTARPLPPHWRKVLDAVVAEPGRESNVARMAAVQLSSPCVVVISVNQAEGTFETRVAGANAGWADMADKIADAALAGINAADPENE